MQNKLLPWPDNIVADRHEVSGRWVLSYLEDDQAKAINTTLSLTPAALRWLAQNAEAVNALSDGRAAVFKIHKDQSGNGRDAYERIDTPVTSEDV